MPPVGTMLALPVTVPDAAPDACPVMVPWPAMKLIVYWIVIPDEYVMVAEPTAWPVPHTTFAY